MTYVSKFKKSHNCKKSINLQIVISNNLLRKRDANRRPDGHPRQRHNARVNVVERGGGGRKNLRILFFSDILAVLHGLPDIRHIEVDNSQYSIIYFMYGIFKSYPSPKTHSVL